MKRRPRTVAGAPATPRNRLAPLSLIYGALLIALTVLASGSLKREAPITVNPRFAGRTAVLSLNVPATDTDPAPALTANQQQNIAVRLDTGGANVQSVHLVLLYPATSAIVQDIVPEDSFCSRVDIRQIEPEKGRAELSCETAPPGFTTQLTTVATLILTPRTAGYLPLSFDRSSTQVISSNKSQDVLEQAGDASFAIRPIAAGSPAWGVSMLNPVVSLDASAFVPLIVPITSPTHPSAGRCYGAATAKISWLRAPGVAGFVYAWDQNASTDKLTTTTASTSLDLPMPPNTRQFFHVQAVGVSGERGPVNTVSVASC